MTSRVVWYVSKYVSPRSTNSVGGRGYLLMAEMAKKDCECVIITSDSNHLIRSLQTLKKMYFTECVDGVQMCWVRTLKYSAAKSFRRILSWLHFEWRLWRLPKKQFPKPDVVIISSLSLLTILNGFLLRRRYKCRLIFEVRDIWPLTIIEEGGFSRFNPLVLALAYIEKLGYKYSDVIVGTMPNLREHVEEVLGYSKKTACIPMGINEEAPTILTEFTELYRKKYIPKDKFIIAHVGSVGIANALETFFKSALAMKGDSEIHFLIVGDGGLLPHYKSKYSNLSNVTFAPIVFKSEVQSVLSLCDLVYFSVHDSKVWEFGQSLNKVIDYMMSGKPILASYSGYPSMINEANCGSYVPAGDVGALQSEVLRYFNMNLEELTGVGMRGRSWLVENRPYKKLAGNYLEILFP